MRSRTVSYFGMFSLLLCGQLMAQEVAPTANGIAFPSDYKNWRTINVSHRLDHHSMRAILGNDKAIEAARAGKTNPWPDGAILGKVLWKEKVSEDWDKAIVGGQFIHAEFMIKDAKKYKDTGGWGYARWIGEDLKPYGKDAHGASAECYACHTPVQKNDYVFTHPALMP